MQKFTFNHEQKQWDGFKAFHTTNGIFVEFETGELAITTAQPHPRDRDFYDKYGIYVLSTSDDNCPQLYLDKECTQPVKKAWLNQNGMQYLSVDEQQKVAVRLGGFYSRKDRQQYLPRNLLQAAVWMGPDRLPVPTNAFDVSVPDKSVRKDLGPKLTEVRAVIRAAHRINPAGSKRYHWETRYPVAAQPSWADLEVSDLVAKLSSNSDTMRSVAEDGFTYPRAVTQHDFLYTKGA